MVKSFRIAMVAACPFPAAFASSGLVRELSIALVARGHKVDIITYHLGDNSFDTENIKIHRIPRVPGYRKLCSGISLGKPFLDFLLCKKLMDVCRKNRFDIIHAHNYEAPPIAYYVRKKLNTPVVYHAHNTMLHELPTYFRLKSIQSFARLAGNFMDHIIPHRANHIVTVSEDQTEYLKSIGVSNSKITTIPPCIFPEILQGGDRYTLRKSLGIGDSPVIIYTGGLQPYQNCKILVDVLKSCIKKMPDLHLLILARSAPDWLKDKAIVSGVYDQTHFLQGHGIQFERDCLATADVGIIPRLHCIGFPVKLLNYLAAGLPVVCFEGINKGFRSGEDVLAVPLGNSEAIAAEVINLIHNRAFGQRLVQSGQETLQRKHTWNQAVDKLEIIYSELSSAAKACPRQ
ncbi:glycosyltransferase family 4 protein [bacterium]|nr:glycosyltransferase family 4 protein [bacterium]